MDEQEIVDKLNSLETMREKSEFLRYHLGMPNDVALAHLRLFDIRQKIVDERMFQDAAYNMMSEKDPDEETVKTFLSFLEKGARLMNEYGSSMLQLAHAIKKDVEEDKDIL